MKGLTGFSFLLQAFFNQRLMKQLVASPHTIKSYRDTFHLFLEFARVHTGKQPSKLEFAEVDAPLIIAFLDDLETSRGITARSRNNRLAAIRSFFRYAAYEVPEQSAHIQRILAIPGKRYTRRLIQFLTREEIDAILQMPDRSTWTGRRDHILLLLAVQTGLRLSEITSLRRHDVVLGPGAHVRVTGKGRKERCTPLSKQTAAVIQSWLNEPARCNTDRLFPNARGGRLSADGVNYILKKYTVSASAACPSLTKKRITPHCLRHSCAMELLQAGIDRAMIALWLGHESVETTQIYLEATLAMKEKILSKTTMPCAKPGLYRPGDSLLAFLRSL